MALKLVKNMEEVGQAMAGGAAFSSGKVLGFSGAGMLLAAIVVMAMTQPKSKKEFIIASICTVVSSLCGGAAVVQYFNLQAWAMNFFGLVAIMGISFTCGLPAWVVIRASFAWAEKNKDKGIPELVRQIKDAIK